jgi:CheY-like chemotaxis protein
MSAQVVRNTILLAEDDANDVWLLRHLLAPFAPQFNLQVVTDGEAAIAYLSGSGIYSDRAAYPFPGMALLDIHLPKIDGIGVLRWIRKNPRCRGMVVIMLTGSESEEHLRQAYELHVNSFLKKAPLLASPEVSRSVLSYWLTFNQSPLPGPD